MNIKLVRGTNNVADLMGANEENQHVIEQKYMIFSTLLFTYGGDAAANYLESDEVSDLEGMAIMYISGHIGVTGGSFELTEESVAKIAEYVPVI